MVTGFFSNALPRQVQGKAGAVYDLIDVGGGLFPATAVALIDHMSLTPRVNDETLKKILDRFYQYFPRYMSNQAYMRLLDRMRTICTNPHKSKVVECMAYVLRQLTVDELYANPYPYRDIFNGLSPDTSKGYLRHLQTPMAASALAALAQTIDLTVALTYKELDKELGRRVLYMGPSQSNDPALVLQVQHAASGNGYVYFPGVKSKKAFETLQQVAITGPQPVENASEHEGTVAQILALIKADNATLLSHYEQHRTTLLSMVNAGELSGDQIRDYYISLLPVEQDASFIMRLAKAKRTMIAGAPVVSEKAVIESRVSALASWIAGGYIPQDLLYNRIDAAPGA